jgi:carbon monoxide dehydrogenase subunit G
MRTRRLVAAALALTLVVSVPAYAAQSGDAATAVTVTEEKGGGYTVSARFTVAEPPSAVLAVLTDYEQIPRFMPSIKRSVVRERGAGHAVVEQEAVSNVLMFSKRVRLRLEVQEGPDAVSFRDACGTSFSRYEGAWHVAVQDGQTVVTYQLSAKPTFNVPDFLLTRVVKRDAKEMIERLRAEIATRARTRLT